MTRKEQIMSLWVTDNDLARSLMISHDAVRLIEYCAELGGAMTYQVAKHFGTSTQSASSRLKKLMDRGYLTRSPVTQKSGGTEYVYYPTVNLY